MSDTYLPPMKEDRKVVSATLVIGSDIFGVSVEYVTDLRTMKPGWKIVRVVQHLPTGVSYFNLFKRKETNTNYGTSASALIAAIEIVVTSVVTEPVPEK